MKVDEVKSTTLHVHDDIRLNAKMRMYLVSFIGA